MVDEPRRKGTPPCGGSVPNTCGHVCAEGQHPDSIAFLCQRPRGHNPREVDGVGCIGCPYCILELTIRATIDRRAREDDGR